MEEGRNWLSRWRFPFALMLISVSACVGWFVLVGRRGADAMDESVLRREIQIATKRGDWADAERALGALSRPTPGEILERAKILTTLERPVEAASQWSRYAAASSNAETELLNFLESLGKEQRLRESFDLLLAVSDRPEGDFLKAEQLLCLRLMELGFPKEAARRVERPLRNSGSLDSASRLKYARIFLSAGNPNRAASLLEADDAATPEEKAERCWLLSRVALQQGDAKAAAASFDRLRTLDPGFLESDQGKRPEPAPFVGSTACAKCHQKKFEIQSKSSHAATLAAAEPKSLSGLPPVAAMVDKLDREIRYSLVPQGNHVAVTADWRGEVVAKGDLTWKLGSGTRGISFLAAERDEVEFAVSHYAMHGWDTTAGHRAEVDRKNPLGRRLSRLEGDRCVGCHATNVEALREARPPKSSATELPSELVAELGVRCESCHGPGLNHVRAAELRLKQDWAISNPAKWTAVESVELCASCHQSSKNVNPQRPEALRFHSATFRASKCFTLSAKLSCVTCHDPHEARPRPAAEHGKHCLECHARPTLPCPPFKSPPFKSPPVKGKAEPSGEEEAASCIRCHMPRTTEVMKHTSYTDHNIRVHWELLGSEPNPVGAEATKSRGK